MEKLVAKLMRMFTLVLIKDKLSEITVPKPIFARCHPFTKIYPWECIKKSDWFGGCVVFSLAKFFVGHCS